jgi:hypothetical protein
MKIKNKTFYISKEAFYRLVELSLAEGRSPNNMAVRIIEQYQFNPSNIEIDKKVYIGKRFSFRFQPELAKFVNSFIQTKGAVISTLIMNYKTINK